LAKNMKEEDVERDIQLNFPAQSADE
jgi:hypothetical protein